MIDGRLRLSWAKMIISRPNPIPLQRLKSPGRLDIPPAGFLFVGDSAVDMKTAISAGMHAVGAGWGFRGPRELTQNGCQSLVSDPLQILNLL